MALFYSSGFRSLPGVHCAWFLFQGCRWEEMLESISILTFGLPSIISLSVLSCVRLAWLAGLAPLSVQGQQPAA